MQVMIASLPIGTGHDIAAQALAEAFVAKNVSVGFSHHLASPIRIQIWSYFWAIRRFPGAYRSLYHRAQMMPGWWGLHRKKWQTMGRDLLISVYEEHRPDWILATHPFALTAWAGVKKVYPQLRLAGILTDLSVHRFWWEPETDAYAVWFPEQVEDLKALGCSRERIWDTGIPIRSAFAELSPVIRMFGEQPIVVLGGGLGLGPYGRTLKWLAQTDLPVLVVCGHNEPLRWRLTEQNWPDNVTILGYVSEMPALLRRSRLVVGKPGGVTAAEVCQSRVPWILTHWIPGQEEANRDRLIRHGLAAVARSGDFPELLASLTASGENRDHMQSRQEQWARPFAAEEIAARVLQHP